MQDRSTFVRGIFALAAALAAAACSNNGATAPNASTGGEALILARFGTPATTASAGNAGNPSDTTSQRVVIGDAATWTRFWASLAPDPNAPAGAAPSVDFSRDMVIAAVSPVRPSGGYSVTIEKVTQYADHIEAEVVERSPGPNCVVTGAITRPFDAVQVPRSAKPVRFVERAAVNTCGGTTADTVRLGFGKPADTHRVRVTLLHVVNDSRCPINALCIWEGDAAVTLRFEQGTQSADVTMHTSPKMGVVSTIVGGAEFQLVGLTPFLVIGQPAPQESDYTAILAVR
jgi:PrcB C-terminal